MVLISSMPIRAASAPSTAWGSSSAGKSLRYKNPIEMEMMRAVKRALDRAMNPGRCFSRPWLRERHAIVLAAGLAAPARCRLR